MTLKTFRRSRRNALTWEDVSTLTRKRNSDGGLVNMNSVFCANLTDVTLQQRVQRYDSFLAFVSHIVVWPHRQDRWPKKSFCEPNARSSKNWPEKKKTLSTRAVVLWRSISCCWLPPRWIKFSASGARFKSYSLPLDHQVLCVVVFHSSPWFHFTHIHAHVTAHLTSDVVCGATCSASCLRIAALSRAKCSQHVQPVVLSVFFWSVFLENHQPHAGPRVSEKQKKRSLH